MHDLTMMFADEAVGASSVVILTQTRRFAPI